MNKLIILTLFILGCSQVNTDSKDHYDSKSFHGIKVTNTPFKPTIKIKSSAELISFGKKTYENNCMACHGKNGLGDGPQAKSLKIKPANLNKAVNEVEHFAFYTKYSYWDGRMPGWDREFSDKEIDALTAYLYQFKKK